MHHSRRHDSADILHKSKPYAFVIYMEFEPVNDIASFQEIRFRFGSAAFWSNLIKSVLIGHLLAALSFGNSFGLLTLPFVILDESFIISIPFGFLASLVAIVAMIPITICLTPVLVFAALTLKTSKLKSVLYGSAVGATGGFAIFVHMFGPFPEGSKIFQIIRWYGFFVSSGISGGIFAWVVWIYCINPFSIPDP